MVLHLFTYYPYYLQSFRGFKRVENYIKSVWTIQNILRTDPRASREDLEAFEIDKERQREQLEAYKTVERIIVQRTAPANDDIDHEHSMYSPDALSNE